MVIIMPIVVVKEEVRKEMFSIGILLVVYSRNTFMSIAKMKSNNYYRDVPAENALHLRGAVAVPGWKGHPVADRGIQ
jgi:hypothetical protein